MDRHSTAIMAATLHEPENTSKKRKRDQSATAEIEVDVLAPEPPSKKALRKAKKGRVAPLGAITTSRVDSTTDLPSVSEEISKPSSAPPKRSPHGIWMGNLPWTATKQDIRDFLTKSTEIEDNMITRLHMPAPSKSSSTASTQRTKPQNQGFAYVDVNSEVALEKALGLSEKLLTGRRILIKDSNSFEGRPEKQATTNAQSGKPPSKRIFVGNLGFDTTKEILQEHFSRCGEILDIHVATFEDTGKCKGYAWVEFTELQAGEAANRGWVALEQQADMEDEDDEIANALTDQGKSKKKPKLRKWWVNRIDGRALRIEYAEGKDVRYKKRYGKEGTLVKDADAVVARGPESSIESANGNLKTRLGKGEDSILRNPSRKVDPRSIKPGAALAAAPRLTGGIIESRGKKITFE